MAESLRTIQPLQFVFLNDTFCPNTSREELSEEDRTLLEEFETDRYSALYRMGMRSRQAAAIMAMIQNNLDPRVAQHPHELITYGGNGAVFQNWAQYRLAMKYLAEMTEEQTLVMY